MQETWDFFVANILPHWPFGMITIIFMVVGQFMSTRVFTKARAYKKRPGPWYKFWDAQWFWWWGRESLPVHPILAGGLVGLLWQNPEQMDPAWPLIASVAYFAGAGVISLFAWVLLRSEAKKRGIDLQLPGGD
jgi:hypothetical protein